MRQMSVLVLASAAMLSGCLGGEVSRVKESKMKGWPEFTVGQLLDKRHACSKTEWKVFTDTRDRKVVEYTCDYALGTAYLKAKQVEDIEEALKSWEGNLASNESVAANTKERIDKTQGELIDLENSLAESEAGIQALKADIDRLKGYSCQNTGASGYNHQQMFEKIFSDLQAAMEQACSNQTPPKGPTSITRHLSRTTEASVRGRAEYVAARRLQEMEEKTKQIPRSIKSKKDHLAYLEETQSTDEKRAPERLAEHEAHMARLRQRGESFQGVREVSQWTVQQKEPVYLGSRIDLVFSDSTVEQPMEPKIIFDDAADNPTKISALYQFILNQMWVRYRKKA